MHLHLYKMSYRNERYATNSKHHIYYTHAETLMRYLGCTDSRLCCHRKFSIARYFCCFVGVLHLHPQQEKPAMQSNPYIPVRYCSILRTSVSRYFGILTNHLPSGAYFYTLLPMATMRKFQSMVRMTTALILVLVHLLFVEAELLFWSVVHRPTARERSEAISYSSASKMLRVLRMMLGVQIDIAVPPALMSYRTIFIANHQSLFDIPIILTFLRHHRTLFIVKHTLQKGFPGVSRLLRLQGHAFINRKSQLLTTMRVLSRFAARIPDERSVVIFPEGTRTTDGTLLPFLRAGLMHMMLHTRRSVTALIIEGSYQLNMGVYRNRVQHPDPIRIRVLEHIDAPATKRDMEHSIDMLEQAYRSALGCT